MRHVSSPLRLKGRNFSGSFNRLQWVCREQEKLRNFQRSRDGDIESDGYYKTLVALCQTGPALEVFFSSCVTFCALDSFI